jgi:branched-chain amino acid transport system ATP-binding protein
MTAISRLAVKDLTLTFGGVKPLDGVSFDVEPGSLTALIGPNGAGKTSLFNCLSGVYRPTSGSLALGSDRIDRLPPHRIASLGIARTFQTPALFEGLSVLENLMAARYLYGTGGLLRSVLRTRGVQESQRAQRVEVDKIVALMGLESLLGARVDSLAYGVMKRVELARSLCQQPQLLLLDEPMAGMTYEEKVEMSSCISTARESFGMSVLLIEHDMGVVMDISERIVVLEFGRKIAEGSPDRIRHDEAVIAAYLGEPQTMAEDGSLRDLTADDEAR